MRAVKIFPLTVGHDPWINVVQASPVKIVIGKSIGRSTVIAKGKTLLWDPGL